MRAFHEEHFSNRSLAHFDFHFMRPEQPTAQRDLNITHADDEDHGDDGWVYYDESAKETATDELIPVFGYPEVETLREATEELDGLEVPLETELSAKATQEFDDGEIDNGIVAPGQRNTGPKRKRKKRGGNKRKAEEKPDLRKRTWDVVEAGLDSLYYDDDEPAEATTTKDARRAQISYGDEW